VKVWTEYDSFGRMVLEVGDLSNPFTYTGRQWDAEAEVYHYRARAYDPVTGRFLQQDPVFSVNPYPYTGNNPVNFTDPFGLDYVHSMKIADYCMGKDCYFERSFQNNTYCEYKGCSTCGTKCQDCIVGEGVESWSKNGPDYSTGCIRENSPGYLGDAKCGHCHWGPKVPDCALECENSNEQNCFYKCMSVQFDRPVGGIPGGDKFGPVYYTPGGGGPQP
jgi:RHS repeat-associated protein